MENDSLLVMWVKESPIRYSIMSRNDLTSVQDRQAAGQDLMDKELLFKWKTKTCTGRVVAFGVKADLEKKLESDILIAKQPTNLIRKKVNKPEAKAANRAKKSKIDTVVSQIVPTEPLPGPSNSNRDKLRIQILEEDLQKEKDLRQAAEAKYEEMKTQFENVRDNLDTNQDVDIGNGVRVNRDVLATMRTVSTTMNIYARNLFKYLFEAHEIVGRSLMGIGCNANKGSPKLPSIDNRRRDAIIGHSLNAFGKQPGSELYKLGMKDLKKSLSALIQEMSNEAKSLEQILADGGDAG